MSIDNKLCTFVGTDEGVRTTKDNRNFAKQVVD